MDFSIIICCYNSEKRIIHTLRYVIAQKLDNSIEMEIVVVNNNSTDQTKSIISDFWTKSQISTPMVIVDEPRPGLSYARRSGVANAKGKYILFCDDDNWLDENYIYNAKQIMEMNSNIGLLGGIGYPVFETGEPSWFDSFKKSYAVGPQAERNGDITFSKGYVYGAGSIFRRRILEELYSKNFTHLLSGRKAKKLISGEDNELGYGIAFMGYQIYYSEDLKFHHFIPTERLNLNYLKGIGVGYANSYDVVKSFERILFSRGNKRRNWNDRRKDFKRNLNEILIILRKKIYGQVHDSAFVYIFYSRFYILRNTIFNWTSNIEREKKIFQLFKHLNPVK